MNIYRFKGNFKSFLFVLALLLTFGFLYYTQTLVAELEKQSREFLSLRIKIFEENINNENVQDLSFFFNEVIQQADYPIIYTDSQMHPLFWRNIGIQQNLNHPPSADTLRHLKKLVREFDKMNPPISISYQGQVLGYYHYGESAIIRKLRWLPYVEIIVVALFILIGYFGFSSIKKSEEQFIWVGMAKETAHQLGTPLSSLIGWVEYLKNSPTKLNEVLPEIEKDLQRLQITTNRFSQIGSTPDLHHEDLVNIIQDTISYFKKRFPSGNGKISIDLQVQADIPLLKINRDLFSWVLENLIKNALDALPNNQGHIKITVEKENQARYYIDVQDTGKGIPSQNRKNIFKPGFSTKRRGWGLGLSLAKRIIEDYHGGKLLLKETKPGEGTTFRIVLKTS